MADINNDQVLAWLSACAEAMTEHKQELTDLDAATGDADHGNNMARGFDKVQGSLEGHAGKPAGDVLKAVAMTLMSSVGGASGPLYGSYFMKAAAAVQGPDGISTDELADMLRAGVDAVKQRGRAETGEKTMIDALEPAAAAAKQAVSDGKDVLAVLEDIVTAAKAGMEYTVELKATKGRASYQGEKSIGHQDPGATSSYYMLHALYDIMTAEFPS
ncbi:MAG: dihydroxyacetone kinase subunit DhaL [Deinococcota bacterium]